jgi:hypothetical protein
MSKPDRANDKKRIPNFAPQPSPFPEGSTKNTKIFTAAEQRDEAQRELYNKYGLEARESAAEHAAAHAEELRKLGM